MNTKDQRKCGKVMIQCNLLYRDGSYCTCNNFQFGKLLNLYKLRLCVRVLLMEVNEHQRSKEMWQSHDTIQDSDDQKIDFQC